MKKRMPMISIQSQSYAIHSGGDRVPADRAKKSGTTIAPISPHAKISKKLLQSNG